MKSYLSSEVMAALKMDGRHLVRIKGNHYQFKHDVKKATVTVQQPVKDLSKIVLKSIERQSGLKFR